MAFPGTVCQLASQSEEHHQRPFDVGHECGRRPTDTRAKVRSADGRDFVDHREAGLGDLRRLVVRHGDPGYRRVSDGRGQRDDDDRICLRKQVVLDDDRRARLGCVDASGDGPQLATVHASSSREPRAEIASTNSMSSLCRSASASASASRRASAANAAERTSGTHTWTGRYPRRRIRSRYSRALRVDVLMLPMLHETAVACNAVRSLLWLTTRANPCRGPIAGEFGRRWLTTILTTTVTTVAPPNTAPTAWTSCDRAWSRCLPATGSVGVRGSSPLSSTLSSTLIAAGHICKSASCVGKIAQRSCG